VRLFRRPAISPKKLEPDETAVFQDEVDVHWNPKIGNCWMPRGKQTEVVTPGNNEKRHVAGSLHWRTGRLLASPPTKRRNRDLFIAHLDDLRVRLRGFRRIHVVCDNAAFHRSRAVERYLTKWRERLQVHFLPKYAPETNPIERVWWHFHETITRNHRCKNLDELLGPAQERFRNNQHAFYAEMKKTTPNPLEMRYENVEVLFRPEREPAGVRSSPGENLESQLRMLRDVQTTRSASSLLAQRVEPEESPRP